jgi:hypothetical protein
MEHNELQNDLLCNLEQLDLLVSLIYDFLVKSIRPESITRTRKVCVIGDLLLDYPR